MKHLKIHVYKSGQETKPETVISIPLSTLPIAIQLLPKKTKTTLEKEGIDLTPCSELTKEKDLKGTLIEIENPTEKLVISVD